MEDFRSLTHRAIVITMALSGVLFLACGDARAQSSGGLGSFGSSSIGALSSSGQFGSQVMNSRAGSLPGGRNVSGLGNLPGTRSEVSGLSNIPIPAVPGMPTLPGINPGGQTGAPVIRVARWEALRGRATGRAFSRPPVGAPRVEALVPSIQISFRNGLPQTTMDSFVHNAGGDAELIYGDENIPYEEFTKEHRIERGITGERRQGLTTGHGSYLPDAFGGDEFVDGPEWSHSGPGQN